ncbi:MAG: hypothetical protein JWM33_4037 [Caulobacteraceae bacterium]|nr:hypothetical protein [Caulobacteraceae bacterium]
MSPLSAWLAERLLDIAAAVAPPSRQAWIEAMRGELGPADDSRLAWASGCLWTAVLERIRFGHPLAPRTLAGLALRLVGGLSCLYCGLFFMTGLLRQLPDLQPHIAPLGLAVLLMTTGGAILLLPILRPRLRMMGRWAFGAVIALLAGGELWTWTYSLSHSRFHWQTLLFFSDSLLSVLTALALIADRRRLFLPLATLATATSLAHLGYEMRYVNGRQDHLWFSYLVLALILCMPVILLWLGQRLLTLRDGAGRSPGSARP